MNIRCGKDVIDVLQVLYVTIRKINDSELAKLEEQYHGYFPGYGLSNEKYLQWINAQILFKENIISETEFKEQTKSIYDIPRRKKREEFLSKYADKSILIVYMHGMSKQYLEDYCGFDIFLKKQEIEKAI